MLEIIFLIWFGKKLAAICRQKGRSEGWVAMGVLFWLGGEFIGIVVGSLLGMGTGSYLVALLLAAIGAGVSWAVINNLPARAVVPAGPIV